MYTSVATTSTYQARSRSSANTIQDGCLNFEERERRTKKSVQCTLNQHIIQISTNTIILEYKKNMKHIKYKYN